MTALSIQSPFPVFNNTNGAPLEAGYVYIGQEGLNPETNPIQVYFDSDLSIPAVQPIRTINGFASRNGSPAVIFADANNYSLLVKDKLGRMVFSSLAANSMAGQWLPEIANYAAVRAYDGSLTSFLVLGAAHIFDGGFGVFRVDGSDTTSADNGGTILVDILGRRWKRDYVGDVQFDWFNPDKLGASDVTSKLQAATDASRMSGVAVCIPDGEYLIDAVTSVLLDDGAVISMSPLARMITEPNNKGYSTATMYQVFRVVGSNVTIKGGQIKGDRELHDYTVSPGNPYEFGHGISVYPTVSISTVMIDGVYIYDCVGDSISTFGTNNGGVYIAASGITIQNCVLEDCRRNNISHVVGSGLIVTNNRITGAGKTKYGINGCAPMAGLDIEGGSSPRDSKISGNTFSGNLGGSIILYNANECEVTENIIYDYPIYLQFAANTIIANNVIRPLSTEGGISQTTTVGNTSGSGKMLAIGGKYIILARVTLDFTTVGAADNNVNTEFVATGFGPLGTGDSVRYIPENVTIIGNQIYGGASGISSSGFSRSVVIEGNHLYSQTTTGITLGTGGTGTGAIGGESCIGNTLLNQAIGIRSSSLPCTIKSNVINTTSSRAIYAPGTSTGGVIEDNTIINHGNAINAAVDISGGAWKVFKNTFDLAHPTVNANYAIFNVVADTKISGNRISGVCGTAVIRTSQKARIVGNELLGTDSPDGIYCSSANGSGSIVAKNTIDSVKSSGTNYGIRFTGGGSAVKILNNTVLNSVGTFTKSIETSANTVSVVIDNIVQGAMNNNGTDTVTANNII